MKIIINKFKFSMLILVIISAFACKNNSGENLKNLNVIGYSELSKEFINFYESFHADTAFQYSHISFPLEGNKIIKSEHGDTIEELTWTRENWVIHKRFDNSDKSFTQEFKVIDDKAVIESISALNGLFNIERRYAKLSDGWNLIYYSQQ